MAGTVNLTGTFYDVKGNLVSNGTVTVSLRNFGGEIPRLAGVAILDSVSASATISNGTFTISGLYGNDVITPSNTYYEVSFPSPVGSGNITKLYNLTGSGTFDLSNLVPLFSYNAPTVPISNVTPQVFAPQAHKFLTGLASSGAFSSAQPTVDDLGNGSTTAVLNWNGDTGISRDSAGVIDVGNGTQGDSSGTVKLSLLKWGTDTGLSRGAAATIYAGNGSAGDRSATVQAQEFIATDAATHDTASLSNSFRVGNTGVYAFTNGGTGSSNTVDTGLSRDSGNAATINVGNGTASDASGTLKAAVVKSSSSNPAASGTVRLAAADTIAFRNAGNSADIALSKSGYDQITATGLSNRILQTFTSTSLTGAGGLSFQAAASKTIKANSLGAHGALLIRLAGSGVTAAGGLANITVQFGGTNKTVLSVPGSTTYIFRLEALLCNQNATGTQLITWTSQYNGVLSTQSNNTYSIDTTSDQTLSLGVIFNNASDNCTFQNMLVEIMPASAAI